MTAATPDCKDCAYMLPDKSADRTPRCWSPHTREAKDSHAGIRCHIERKGACGSEGVFFEKREAAV